MRGTKIRRDERDGLGTRYGVRGTRGTVVLAHVAGELSDRIVHGEILISGSNLVAVYLHSLKF